MWHLSIKYIAIATFIVVDGYITKPAKDPLIPERPFAIFWNAPTGPCKRRFNVTLELATYSIVSNPNETLSGSTVTIFYFNRLGNYPFVDGHGNAIHGGVPQNQDLFKHLTKAKSDIDKIIPMKMFNGFGIIDWERWHPLWARNWDDKEIYRNLSIDLVRQRHPNWDEKTIQTTAIQEFEMAARTLMNSTLFLARTMRPYGVWGYFPFPNCYNYDFKLKPVTYKGQCPKNETAHNDQMFWLWKQSSALFPSIYLPDTLKSSPHVLGYVQHRVLEALRIAARSRDDYDLPVFVYTMPVYQNTTDVLTEEDLVHTIGESAALGAAGAILWGSKKFGRSKDFCVLLRDYVAGPLGRYVLNVTAAAHLCSQIVCVNHGKCIRRISKSKTYLHLPSPSFKIRVRVNQFGKRVIAQGNLNNKQTRQWRRDFMCQCFLGWTGYFCDIPCSHKKGQVWY